MKAKVDAIASHGINCFVNRQLIYNYPESLLAEKGIMTIEHADFEGVERLSLVTGGEIASTFDRPDLVKLGRCELIEEIMIGEDKVNTQTLGRDYPFLISTLAHQIFRSRRRRGLYCSPPRFYYTNG
jgi:chaperonin GroEL (HSP60 family)